MNIKWTYFLSNIGWSVTAFEVGSHEYISTRNHTNLYSLDTFVYPGVKLKYNKNFSALLVYLSFDIFGTRKELIFACGTIIMISPFTETITASPKLRSILFYDY